MHEQNLCHSVHKCQMEDGRIFSKRSFKLWSLFKFQFKRIIKLKASCISKRMFLNISGHMGDFAATFGRRFCTFEGW